MPARRPRVSGTKALTKKLVTIEGIPDLQRNIDRLLAEMGGKDGRTAGEGVKRVLMGGALIIRDECRDLAPVKTGKLRSAIFAAYGKRGSPDVLIGVNTRIAVGKSGSGYKTYAGVIEFGNATHQPQPYMRPGITAARPSAVSYIAGGLRDLIQQILPR